MVTEDELRDVLTAAAVADDAAAERYTLGLSDRALAMANGRQIRRWTRFAPGVAVGTAFVVAGAFGVLALNGAIGGGDGGGRVTVMNAPTMAADPAAMGALVDFEVECFDGHGPKLAMDWVWDPESQQYHAVDSPVYTAFTPSPDGRRALVVQGLPAARWAVADWSDAVAGRLTYHELSAPHTGAGDVLWTTDGSAVTGVPVWADMAKPTDKPVLESKTADFYDPATGVKQSTPIPAVVIDRINGGQWLLQQWQKEHGSVVFPMVSVSGDRVEWLDSAGKVVRTVTVRNGLPAATPKDVPALEAAISPDGRYLAEFDGTVVATFDLQAAGRRIAQSTPADDLAGAYYKGWTGPHEMAFAIDTTMKDTGKPDWKPPKTGHNPVYRVLGPDLKVIEETRFTLSGDPQGYCSSWPVTWAPKTRFPGAFVP